MAMRVATFATSERMLSTAMRIQAKTSELQMQEASGYKATDYGGLGTSAKQVLDLESTLSRSQSYSSAASEASNRVEVMYDALSGITDLLTSFRSELTSMMSTDASEASLESLSSIAQSNLEELTSLLNTNYEGRYLFAGDNTEVAPVDLSAYSTDIDTESTDYYTGNSSVLSVQVARDQTVSYGITADESAFEQAIRVLSSVAAGGTVSSEDLQEAYDMVTSALDATTALQTTLSGKASTIERAINRQSEYQSQLEATISGLKDADVTAVAVQLSTYQTQLEAAYAAIGKIQSLSLADYLR